MDVLLARQPIFDRNQNVFGYELLYRGIMPRDCESFDGDRATSEVIINSFQVMGIEHVTTGKKAFINFTKNLICEEIPQFLEKEKVIIEILENVEVDEAVIQACESLKNKGYILALDDFIFENLQMVNPLLPYVDIIKVDFLGTEFCGVKKNILKVLASRNKKFLAEKVESHEQYELALSLGFTYFQGYFFEKPYVMMGKDIESYKTSYLQMLAEINTSQDFDKLAEIVCHDVGLSYKLMRLVNSPFYSRGNTIKTPHHALMMLGLQEVRKWVTLLMLREVGKDKPDEIMRISLQRGKFCELLAEDIHMKDRKGEAFLLGLFSTLDAMLDQPLEEVVAHLPFEKDLKEAYNEGSHSPFASLLRVARHYEKGTWEFCEEDSLVLKLTPRHINQRHMEAVLWADSVMATIA